MYQPLVPRPLWTAVVDQLRELITSGQIPVGSRLPSERQLCTELGVSRVSLREAIRVLQSEGYVETRPGSGTFATIPQRQVVDWLEEGIHIVELFELRLVIEPGTAGLAAKHRTDEDLVRMQEQIDALAAAQTSGDLDAAVTADTLFHALLGQSVSNPAISQLIRQTQDLCGMERQASLTVPGQIARAVAGHQAILDAIAKRDQRSARDAMAQHLEDAMSILGEYHSHRYVSTDNSRQKEQTND